MNADKTNAERSPLDSESRALTPSRAAPLPKKKNGAPFGNKNASRLNPKVRQALALYLADDITIEQACERVGIHPATYYRAQHSDAFARHFAEVGKKRLNSHIGPLALKGFENLVKAAKSEYTRDSVYTRTLQATGVLPSVDARAGQPSAGNISIVINAPQRSIGAASVQLDAQPVKDDDKSEG